MELNTSAFRPVPHKFIKDWAVRGAASGICFHTLQHGKAAKADCQAFRIFIILNEICTSNSNL